MSFTVTQLLAEDEFKVVGTDVNGTYGEVKLVSPAWAEVIAREAHKAAAEVFDEYATEFLKPLIEGIEAAERIAHPSTNQWSEYVIDEGIDVSHPDLAANVWQNPYDPVNGRDDDGNGFIDDVHGFNFVTNTGDPMDDNLHGTHCAGTIGGAGHGTPSHPRERHITWRDRYPNVGKRRCVVRKI